MKNKYISPLSLLAFFFAVLQSGVCFGQNLEQPKIEKLNVENIGIDRESRQGEFVINRKEQLVVPENVASNKVKAKKITKSKEKAKSNNNGLVEKSCCQMPGSKEKQNEEKGEKVIRKKE